MPASTKKQTSLSFLQGGGEMGELICSKDWIKTPVGAIAKWPQSLRTTLGIIIKSKFPMFLWWGPELICFYNDAYRPSLGNEGKHPSILGMPAKEAWPEIWDIIKPLIDQVLAGGEATWSEDQLVPIFRNGRIEDVYWTFSYSPVNDECGKIAGVLVTCNETTDKVITRKKLNESKEQLEFAIDAAKLGTWDYNPATNKLIANDRLKEWFGLPRETEIELGHAINVIAEKDRQRVLSAVKKILDYYSGGNYDIEYTIINPLTKKETIVQAKGKAWFNDEKVAHRFNGTLEDVTEKVAARKRIEESEERFRNIIKQAPMGITILSGPEFVVEMANETYLQVVGKKEKDFVGRSLFESLPEVREVVGPLLAGVLKSGIPYYGYEFPININRYGKEELTYFNFVYYPMKEGDGFLPRVIVVATDVTPSVKAKQTLAESEKQFRNMVDHSPVAMAILRGKEHIIEIANKTLLQKIWRKKATDLLGKSLLDVFPELNEQKYAGFLDMVYITGKAHSESDAILQLHDNKGPNKFYVDFEFAPLPEANNGPPGIMITLNDVTGQVEARRRVEESEQRLRSFVEGAPFPIGVYTGREMRIQFANQSILDVWGKGKDVTGKKLSEVLPELVGQGIYEQLDKVFTTGIPFHAHNQRVDLLINDKLIPHYFNYSFTPLFDINGNIYGVMNNAAEVTDLMIAKQKIEDSEKRLNLVIEASELGTWELNLRTSEAIYSDRYLEILGYNEKINLTHTQILAHFYPDDLPIREEAFRQAFITGVLHYKSRILWKDKSVHWIEAQGKVFYDENNQPLRLMGTVRDITDEKYYEQGLQEREQKFRLLADSMPQFVWTGDAEGKLYYFNYAVYNYTGLIPEQIEKEGWLQIVHPDDREENIKRWMHTVKTGTDFLFEHRFRRHDGEYRWQLSRALPVKDSAGKIQMWVGTSTDIDEIKKHQQEKDDFIKIASHELKTPVTTIKAYVQLLLKQCMNQQDSMLVKSLSTIDKQITKLAKLIADLLDVTKIEMGSFHANKENFSLTELLRDVINNIQATTNTHKVLFNTPGDILVYADKDRITQVLTNLLINAIKYSPNADKVIANITMKTNEVIVSIQDFGIGMAPRDHKKIFERFYRAEHHEGAILFPGFGIGLFIVKEIIANHKGKVWVESERNKGSTFYFSLPA
ncbi:MAG: PAS domain S-box protein [Chitinophagaceae bacterium]